MARSDDDSRTGKEGVKAPLIASRSRSLYPYVYYLRNAISVTDGDRYLFSFFFFFEKTVGEITQLGRTLTFNEFTFQSLQSVGKFFFEWPKMRKIYRFFLMKWKWFIIRMNLIFHNDTIYVSYLNDEFRFKNFSISSKPENPLNLL